MAGFLLEQRYKKPGVHTRRCADESVDQLTGNAQEGSMLIPPRPIFSLGICVAVLIAGVWRNPPNG